MLLQTLFGDHKSSEKVCVLLLQRNVFLSYRQTRKSASDEDANVLNVLVPGATCQKGAMWRMRTCTVKLNFDQEACPRTRKSNSNCSICVLIRDLKLRFQSD